MKIVTGKRLGIVISILILMCMILPAISLANSSGFTIDGNGVLTAYSGTETTVIIPNNVTRIAERVFADNKTIQTVTFPSSLEVIESGAFSGSSLISVAIPDGIKLGGGVFSGSSLQNATFEGNVFCLPQEDEPGISSEDVCAIPRRTFAGCSNLSLVSLPPQLSAIEYNAFDHCTALKTIELPEGLKTIGNGAFSWSGLTEIYIPGSAKIGQGVFQQCEYLTNVYLEEGITSISNAAFSASGLERIFFPESMTTFTSAGIFADTNHLMVIKFLARDPQFTRGEDFFGDYAPIRDGDIEPTIYGYKGTQAEALAKKANLVFVPLEEEDGGMVDSENEFDALHPVEIPTIIVRPGQDGELTYELDKNVNNKGTVVYNVHMRDEYDGKPVDLIGECILCFPYPEGLNETSLNKYRIIIHHYSGNGKTEVFKSENGDINFTKQGLCIRVSSLSPFEITWEGDGSHLPKTGDNSQIIVWIMLLTMAGTAMLTLKRKTA